MTYHGSVIDVVKVIEAVGAGIMVFGGVYAFAVCGLALRDPSTRTGS
jgi:hypothetical protein